MRTLHLDDLVVVDIDLLQARLLELGLATQVHLKLLATHDGHGVLGEARQILDLEGLLRLDDDLGLGIGLDLGDIDVQEGRLILQGERGREGANDGMELAGALCCGDKAKLEAIRSG